MTKKQTYLTLAIGATLSLIGIFASNHALIYLGNFITLFACWSYAEAKGYRGIIGLILGMCLNIFGFIILALMPTKNKVPKI